MSTVSFNLQPIKAWFPIRRTESEREMSWKLDSISTALLFQTSLDPWLVQEEKLSYSESLREPTGSTAGLLVKLEEDEASSPLKQLSPLFPPSAWQSALRPPEPVSGYRLLELLWFSLFKDSKEKLRESGWLVLTGIFSMGISFCREKGTSVNEEQIHASSCYGKCCSVNFLRCPVSTLTTVSTTVIYIEIFVTLNDQMYVLGAGRHSSQGIWSPRHSSCYINCAIQRYYFFCITSDHLLCRNTLVKKLLFVNTASISRSGFIS